MIALLSRSVVQCAIKSLKNPVLDAKFLISDINFHLRTISQTRIRYHEDTELSNVPETINVTFITKDGQEIKVKAKEGERALYLAHR